MNNQKNQKKKAKNCRFICFVRIEDSKFDIIIDDDNRLKDRLFYEIYEKIQQIFEIAFNKSITFVTHVFERVDAMSNQSSIVRTFEDKIKHLSIINMREKVQAIRPGIVAIDDTDSLIVKEKAKNIKVFKQMVNIINEIDCKQNWDFSVKPEVKWKVISRNLVNKDPTLRDYSHDVCDKTFNTLAAFYAESFDKLNLRIGEELQETFDLLKSVHTLNADKVFSPPLSTKLKTIANKPEIKDYLKYGFNADVVIIQQTKRDIPRRLSQSLHREKRRKARIESARSCSAEPFRIPKIDKEKEMLKEDQIRREINAFNLIVQSIDIDWDFRSKARKKWKLVSQSVIKTDKTLSDFIPKKCENTFNFWVQFYVKTFDKFNAKLEPELQKTFDILKVIHTLNAKRVIGEYKYIYRELDRIGESLGLSVSDNNRQKPSKHKKKSKKGRKETESENSTDNRPKQ